MVCRARKTRPTKSLIGLVLVQLQQSRFQLDQNFGRLLLEGLPVLIESVVVR